MIKQSQPSRSIWRTHSMIRSGRHVTTDVYPHSGVARDGAVLFPGNAKSQPDGRQGRDLLTMLIM